MLKINENNVTRVSEDHLYITLDSLAESDPVYDLIESELDRRIELTQRLNERKLHNQINDLLKIQKIQNEMMVLFYGVKGKKTLFLIDKLGQDFIDDYTLDEATFTVYSKAENGFYNAPTSWELGSIQQARSKLAKLLYDRIYNRFMRDAPTTENLELLKRVVGDSCVSSELSY